MRIAVISDIHSNLEAMKVIWEDMGEVDLILNLGDLVGYGADPNAVVDLIRGSKVRVISILGNHDYASVSGDVAGFNPYAARAALWTNRVLTEENKGFLENLPLSQESEIEGRRFYMVHGSPDDPLNEYVLPNTPRHILKGFLEDTKANMLLMGHTHIPMRFNIERPEGIILNPGAVGQSRDGIPKASYVVVDIGNDALKTDIRRIEYDIDSAAKKILVAGLPPILAYRLFKGW